jgi:hypothetical protein
MSANKPELNTVKIELGALDATTSVQNSKNSTRVFSKGLDTEKTYLLVTVMAIFAKQYEAMLATA